MGHRFKVLVYENMYVDENITMLEGTIYGTNIPVLYESNTTIDDLVNRALDIKNSIGDTIITQEYIDNLKKCQMKDVILSFDIFSEESRVFAMKMHGYTCPHGGDYEHCLYEYNKLSRSVDYAVYIKQLKDSGVKYPESAFNKTELVNADNGMICPVCSYTQKISRL